MAQDPDRPLDDGRVRMPRTDAAMNRVAPSAGAGSKGSKDDKQPVALRAGPRKLSRSEEQAIVRRALKNFERASKADDENRKAGLDDDKFYYGEQWPSDILQQRNADKRPALTINKLPTFVHQVTNDQRQNRLSINVSPVGDRSDVQGAQMFRGLVRAIERNSTADIAYDTGFESAARKGWGYWRVVTQFESPDSFHQEILIKRVRNAFSVYMDPNRLEPDGADAKFGFITEMIPREDFKAQYPKADPMHWSVGGVGDSAKLWIDQHNVRIAEYFEIVHETRKLVMLSNGHVGWEDELADHTRAMIEAGRIDIEDERESDCPKVHWYLLTAKEILEERDWPGRYIPIIECVGDEIDIEGKVKKWGIVRHAKDAQRMYNYWATSETENVALAPKAKFLLAEGQDEGYEQEWNQAHTRSSPVLHYRQRDLTGQPAPPPIPTTPPQIPAAVVNAKQGAAQDMQATTGIRFDATLQERVYDESGRALRELRRSGDLGSFHFTDNFARSLRHTGEILIDLIPKIYDTKRVLTILREDDREELVQLDPSAPPNSPDQRHPVTQKAMKVFNPSLGKYGVTVTIGPSYATKRIEAAESMMDFVRAMPNAGALIMDLVAKSQDWPEAETIATRLAKAIPPQYLTPEVKDVPPQVQAIIQSLDTQVKQLTAEKGALLAQLTDQQADRAQRQDKIEKDFESKLINIVAQVETKMAAVQQKAEQTFITQIGSRLEALGEGVNLLRETLANPPEKETKH
jgi:hypothetical protein